MNDRCAFNDTLMHGGFGCRHAQSVTRRAGPDFACMDADAGMRCAAVFDAFKAAGLPALGYQDDLLSMPHSVILKLKFGGLLGLQRLLQGAAEETVPDIAALLDAACTRYGGPADMPCALLVDDMRSQGSRRRQRKS